MRSFKKSSVGENWVLNASPLILLAQIGQLQLIAALSEAAIVPEAVAAEILAGPVGDPARRWIEAGSLRATANILASTELQAWDLGAGETAVLAQAVAKPGWVAVLDDAAARRCARSFSVPLLRTLAIIVRGRQRNLIPSAADAVRALKSVGFRIDDHLVQTVLKHTVQEDWP